jgi:threonine/homoserine/homoserine lactone efflux protein
MITFTIAFLPQFVDRQLGHVAIQFAVLGAIFLALEFVVDGTVGVLAGRIGHFLLDRHRARRSVDLAAGGISSASASGSPQSGKSHRHDPSDRSCLEGIWNL